MNDKLQNVLAELAEKFGTTVEHLWAVMLKQAAISGAMSLVNILFIGGFAYAVYRYARWFFNKDKRRSLESFADDMGHPIAITVLIIVASGVALIGIPGEISNAVTAWGNPEYWALMRVLR